MIRYEIPASGVTSGKRWNVHFGEVSSEHWSLLRDDTLEAYMVTQWQECIEAASEARKTGSTGKKTGGGKGQSSKTASKRPSALEMLEDDLLSPRATPQDTLKKVEEFLEELHSMQLQAAYNMGGIKIVDQYLTDNLMADFTRVQFMLGEELMNNIHGTNLQVVEAADRLKVDILRYLGPNCPPTMRCGMVTALDHFRVECTAFTMIPEFLWDHARNSADEFMWQCLVKAASQEDAWDVVEELVSHLTASHKRIFELFKSPLLVDPQVAARVLTGLAAAQPLVVSHFCGALEGLMGRIGLNMTSNSDTTQTPPKRDC